MVLSPFYLRKSICHIVMNIFTNYDNTKSVVTILCLKYFSKEVENIILDSWNFFSRLTLSYNKIFLKGSNYTFIMQCKIRLFLYKKIYYLTSWKIIGNPFFGIQFKVSNFCSRPGIDFITIFRLHLILRNKKARSFLKINLHFLS